MGVIAAGWPKGMEEIGPKSFHLLTRVVFFLLVLKGNMFFKIIVNRNNIKYFFYFPLLVFKGAGDHYWAYAFLGT